MTKEKIYIYFSALIILLGFCLRSYQAGLSPLSGDESINIIRSVWIIKFFTSHNIFDLYGLAAHTHPPLELLAPIVFIANGLTEYKARLAAILIGSLTPIMFIGLYKNWFSRRNLFLTATIVAVSPFAVGWSRIAALPAFHMGYSLIVLWSLARVFEKNDRRSLIALSIIYGFSFWIMLDYVLLLPIIFYLFIRHAKNHQILKDIVPAIIFISISGAYLIPYIIVGFKFAPKTLGINYNFGRNFHSNILNNVVYYFSTFILHWTVLPFVAAGIVNLFGNKNNKSILWKTSVAYVSCYLVFYLLIYGRNQAYLYGIYMPILVLGSISISTILKKYAKVTYLSFVILSLLMILNFYNNGASDTSAIWGFNKNQNISNSAYLIRNCTSKNDQVISDLDGFQTSLYFNRKYHSLQDTKGLNYVLKNKQSESGAVFIKNRLKLTQPCQTKAGNFYQKYWNTGSVIDFYR